MVRTMWDDSRRKIAVKHTRFARGILYGRDHRKKSQPTCMIEEPTENPAAIRRTFGHEVSEKVLHKVAA